MSAERTTSSTSRGTLPFVAAQPLVDHHCHGLLRSSGDLAGLLNEADGAATAAGTPFDSLAGLALRRWCPPLLGLPPHASVESYQDQRAALGSAEVSQRFLGASGLAALCVDTGYTPADLMSPGETASIAGAAAFEVVRLEQVAESLARSGVRAADFPDAYRRALSERVTTPSFGIRVVGFKSVAAYRVGLELDGRRPGDDEVVAAASRWLGGTAGAGGASGAGGAGGTGGPSGAAGAGGADGAGGAGGAGGAAGGHGAAGRADAADVAPPRLADEVLHRFFVWCGADLGLPVQFHVGYGDRDIDLHRCNPLLLTGLLRALEPTGVPVMLLHNYPYHREAGYLAQVFPLVYADLGLATHNVGARATALLGEALELVPLRKFLFSSDAFGLPELYYLGTLLFRRALSAFLSSMVDADDMSYAEAERITRLIGAENAREAYRLD